ncbi:MAG: hypothetical protein J0H05_16090, partial [Stenotrophomonas acidaminiphila]|nr:hypothetical protein [Stenotrophomonas acidaminiphila]
MNRALRNAPLAAALLLALSACTPSPPASTAAPGDAAPAAGPAAAADVPAVDDAEAARMGEQVREANR